MNEKMNTQVYRSCFAVVSGTVLKVFHHNGDISIDSWQRDYIGVEVIKQHYWWTRFFKGPEINITTGKEFVIRTQYPTFFHISIPVKYRIRVPQRVQVAHVETSSGRINLTNVHNPVVKTVTSTGNITVTRATGKVDATTSTGKGSKRFS